MSAIDPVIQRAHARVGQVLRGKWRLDRLLGMGGMAAVYAGTHRNGSRGAVKMLHLELSLDPEIRQRFLREGYASNAVGHPGAVRVLDDDVAEDGSVFLVMELLSGETLDARWERLGRRLEPGDVLCAIDPVLSVLVEAHAKGIVHRDIKPENLFLTADGTIKLLDFGIARLREHSAASATRSGSTMGTPAFMPPEQALGRSREVGPTSDLWAVGATMFTLLCGRFVHEGQTVNEQLVAAATRPAPPLGTVAPWVPPPVVTLVDRALAFDPAHRWPDAATMQGALREAYHAMVGSPVQTAPKLAVPVVDDEVETEIVSPARRSARASRETTGASAAVEQVAGPSAGPHAGQSRWTLLAVAAGSAALATGAAALLLGARTTAIPATEVVASSPASLPASAPVPSGTSSATPVAPSSAAPASGGAQPELGEIRITVHGGSCELLVDDRSVAKGKSARTEIVVGEHRVSCKLATGQALHRAAMVKGGTVEDVTFYLQAPSIDPRDRRR